MNAPVLAALAGAALALGACSGSGALGTSNQVIVHLDENPNDLAAAQRIADAECRQRGGRARFVLRVANSFGSRDSYTPLPPDAVFACDPAS
jgi:hypothetical protein